MLVLISYVYIWYTAIITDTLIDCDCIREKLESCKLNVDAAAFSPPVYTFDSSHTQPQSLVHSANSLRMSDNNKLTKSTGSNNNNHNHSGTITPAASGTGSGSGSDSSAAMTSGMVNQKVFAILSDTGSSSLNMSHHTNIEMVTDEIAAAVLANTIPTHYHHHDHMNRNSMGRQVSLIDNMSSPLVQFKPLSAAT